MTSECRVCEPHRELPCLAKGKNEGPGHWRMGDKEAIRATKGGFSVLPEISPHFDLCHPNFIAVFPTHW